MAHRVDASLLDVAEQRQGLILVKTNEGPPVSCSILTRAIGVLPMRRQFLEIRTSHRAVSRGASLRTMCRISKPGTGKDDSLKGPQCSTNCSRIVVLTATCIMPALHTQKAPASRREAPQRSKPGTNEYRSSRRPHQP